MKRSNILSLAAFVARVSSSLYNEGDRNHTCVLQPSVESCSAGANPDSVDTCCTETYGGVLLLIQAWSTYTGLEDMDQLLPADAWTIHGLWPSRCDGTLPEYCDFSRQYDIRPSPNTTTNGTLIPPYTGEYVKPWIDAGTYDLLEYMNVNWVNTGYPNHALWMHEFSRHATCFSTFDTPCYGPLADPKQTVVDYIETTVLYHQRLPTWNWLQSNGIVPSNTTTYTLSDLEDALQKEYGQVPFLGCTGPSFNETEAGAGSDDNGYTVLSEADYFFNVYGRPQEGVWVARGPVGDSTCAKAPGAILYPERNVGSVRLG